VGIFRTDAAGDCLFVNPRWCGIAGLTPEEASGDGWIRGLHPEDRERVASEWYEAATNDSPFKAEYRFRSPDGVTTWVVGTANAIKGPRGEILGYVGTISDISDQKRTEWALRERVKELTCLYAVSRIVEEKELSRQEMLQRTVEQLPPAWQYPDSTCARILFEDQELVSSGFRETPWKLSSPIVVDGGAVGAVEVYYLDERPELFEGPFLREERSLLDEIAVRLADTLERGRTEAAARQLRDELAHLTRVTAMGELLASIAHELRQPLTAILSNAEAAQCLLAAEPPDLDEVRAALTEIVDDNERAATVIERLRDLLKPGKHERLPLDINEVAREVLLLVRAEAVEKNISMRLDPSVDPLPVLGDRIELQQVLMNLVLNAFEAMSRVEDSSRQLLVETRQEARDAVAVSVSDTGVGLEGETLEHLFDPFFTTKPEGLGMGLAICRALVADHGGRLWATGNSGRGATFHLTLPASRHGEP
jgi:PAS domain S-box-containing protein